MPDLTKWVPCWTEQMEGQRLVSHLQNEALQGSVQPQESHQTTKPLHEMFLVEARDAPHGTEVVKARVEALVAEGS